jgi:hypothetical protein
VSTGGTLSTYCTYYIVYEVNVQVGVKAPGRANKTTLLPLNKSSEVTSFQSNGFSSSDSMRVRVLKTTEGTAAPSLMGVDHSGLAG